MKMPSVQNTPLNRMFLAGITVILALAPGRMLADTGAAPAPISYSTGQVINEGDSDAVIAEKAAKVFTALHEVSKSDWTIAAEIPSCLHGRSSD